MANGPQSLSRYNSAANSSTSHKFGTHPITGRENVLYSVPVREAAEHQ